MRIPPYDSYKDSGDNWLPQVPSHWTVNRNKIAFRLSKHVVGSQSSEYQLLSLTLNGIIHRDIESGFGKMPADFGTYQRVEPGDLVFCLFDIDETPRTIGLSQYQGMITGAYAVFKCTENAIAEYIYYFYLHIDSIKGLRPFYTGLRKVVRSETFANIKLALPPLIEQQAIATFLDHETARIDTLIKKQQKLIVLLKEKRQAVISHVVTKGLDPNVPMKESGVEWLGEVPEHWDVAPIKHISSFQSGIAKGRSVPPDEVLHVPYIRVANVQDGFLDLTDVADLEIRRTELSRYLLKEGDVLMNEGGDFDKLGRGAIWNGEIEPCIHQNHVFAIRPTNVESEWLTTATQATYAKFYFILVSKQSTNLASISSSNLKEAPIVMPPQDERMSILKFISEQTNKIDALMEKAEYAVELLQERRTALISAAVTGKIDVRNHPSARAAA